MCHTSLQFYLLPKGKKKVGFFRHSCPKSEQIYVTSTTMFIQIKHCTNKTRSQSKLNNLYLLNPVYVNSSFVSNCHTEMMSTYLSDLRQRKTEFKSNIRY